MSKLIEIGTASGHWDASRIESVNTRSYTKGACDKVYYELKVTMMSGSTHYWTFYRDESRMRDLEQSFVDAANEARA